MPDPAPTPAPAKAKPPGRRRPGPNGPKSANRNKNYASENDAAGLEPNFNPDFVRNAPKGGAAGGAPNGGPSTPRRKAQKNNANSAQAKSPAAPNQNQQSASGKPSRRNKNGPKNGAASNASNKQQHQHQQQDNKRTPPAKGTASISLQGGANPSQDPQLSSSAPATQAFAGNSFHASPAPSALPRPAFMRGAVALTFASPESPRAQPTSGLSLVQQPSPPASDSELPSAIATTNDLDPSRNAPRNAPGLDALFQAHRAEKEKQNQTRRASVSNVRNGALLQPFASPQVDTVSDNASSYTFPRDVSQQPHQLPVRRAAPSLNRSSSGISAAELDGTPGQPIGPSFATPFQERMRAVKPADIRGSQSGAVGGHGGFAGGFHGFQNAAPGQQTGPLPGTPGSYLLTPPLVGPSPGSSMNSGSELEASLKRMIFNPPSASPSSAPSATRHQPQPQPGFVGHQAAAHIVPGAFPRGDGMYANNGSPSHNSRGPLPPVHGRPLGHIDPRFEGGSPSFNGRPHNGHAYNGQPFNGQAYNGHSNIELNGASNSAGSTWNHANMENSLRQILRLSPDRN